jgi:hypothetical protein
MVSIFRHCLAGRERSYEANRPFLTGSTPTFPSNFDKIMGEGHIFAAFGRNDGAVRDHAIDTLPHALQIALRAHLFSLSAPILLK